MQPLRVRPRPGRMEDNRLKNGKPRAIVADMTSYEMFAMMPQGLATRILEEMAAEDKAFYRGLLDGVAQARKVRLVYMERQPRTDRHQLVAATLARPAMEPAAANLLRTWFLKKQNQLLIDFLDALGVTHEKGVVDDLPGKVDDEKIKAAVDTLLAKHPPDVVALYLHSFLHLNDVHWHNLEELLFEDPRLELKK